MLDIEVWKANICLPCLSLVSFPLDDGDEREVRRNTLNMTPVLWEEGLAETVRDALERARRRGIKDADRALADIDTRGGRTTIARAIVRTLAYQLVAEMRAPLN